MADQIEYSTTGKPHPYHLVRPSIWPLVASFAGFLLAVGTIMYMHDVHLFADKEAGVEGFPRRSERGLSWVAGCSGRYVFLVERRYI